MFGLELSFFNEAFSALDELEDDASDLSLSFLLRKRKGADLERALQGETVIEVNKIREELGAAHPLHV